MNVIVVDDERIILNGMVRTASACMPDAQVRGFLWAEDALHYAKENLIAIALLDIEMPEMNGVELAMQLRAIQPQINIIFTTSYDQYTGTAIRLHASGYLMKPITAQDLLAELKDLRYPVGNGNETSFWVQAFGNFEVFHKGKPLHFRYSKTKEMLAYLIDRMGAMCTNGELQAILWEDSDDDARQANYLKQLRKDLMDVLKEIGMEKIVASQRGQIGICPDEVNCDYYDVVHGKTTLENVYHGEYMNQYSWAEPTHAWLEQRVNRI